MPFILNDFILDARVYYRTKRLISEKGQRVAEAKLRKDQAITTGKKEHATLIGHIGLHLFFRKNLLKSL